MPRAYVFNALIPRGGTFMAYHIGLILQQEFGYEMVDVPVYPPMPGQQFDYELVPPSVNIAQLEHIVTDDDLLVINPALSRFMFGLRLPGRKISYVQDFRTFQILDCQFDLYVSVSTPVQDFLRVLYGIETTLIPPFIQWERLPQSLPWRARPERSALMYVKAGTENEAAADYLRAELSAICPNLQLDIFKDRGLSHLEFMRRIGMVRYLINVSLAEGFGLVPLEAMALGTCVAGLDGMAGRDYMRFKENAMTLPLHDIKLIPQTIRQLLLQDDVAEVLTLQAATDARCYDLASFRAAWCETLQHFLS